MNEFDYKFEALKALLWNISNVYAITSLDFAWEWMNGVLSFEKLLRQFEFEF